VAKWCGQIILLMLFRMIYLLLQSLVRLLRAIPQ
jgi:hypothetical protein